MLGGCLPGLYEIEGIVRDEEYENGRKAIEHQKETIDVLADTGLEQCQRADQDGDCSEHKHAEQIRLGVTQRSVRGMSETAL